NEVASAGAVDRVVSPEPDDHVGAGRAGQVVVSLRPQDGRRLPEAHRLRACGPRKEQQYQQGGPASRQARAEPGPSVEGNCTQPDNQPRPHDSSPLARPDLPAEGQSFPAHYGGAIVRWGHFCPSMGTTSKPSGTGNVSGNRRATDSSGLARPDRQQPELWMGQLNPPHAEHA